MHQEEHVSLLKNPKVGKFVLVPLGILLILGVLVVYAVKRSKMTAQDQRPKSEPVRVQLLGEDTPSEEVDIGQIVPPGWEYRFEGPSTTRVLFDDGTSGPITQDFGVKGGKIRFTGPDGQKATVRPIPPRSS